MKFLPYERLKIYTALSTDVVLKHIDDVIEPKRYLRLFGSSTKPYEGTRDGSHFEISRIIGYRNSFLPMIKGDVQSEVSGCSIYITMHPHILVIAFMSLWLGGVGFGFFVSLFALISSLLTEPNDAEPTILLPLTAMLAFGYGVFLGGFKFESIKSKKYFQELFRARNVEEYGIFDPLEKAG